MGEQIIPEYKLHNLGLGHVMLWRGGAAYRNFTWRLFCSSRILQIKWRPDPSPVLSRYFPSSTKEERIYTRGNGKGEEESLSKPLYFYRSVVTLHNKWVNLLFFCFYYILTSSEIYYWTDPGLHGIYLFDRKVTGPCKGKMKDLLVHWLA